MLLLQFAVILNPFILDVMVRAYMWECDMFSNNSLILTRIWCHTDIKLKTCLKGESVHSPDGWLTTR